MEKLPARLGIDHRLREILAAVMEPPVVVLPLIGAAGLYFGLSISDVLFGLTQVGLWIIGWTIVGLLSWPLLCAPAVASGGTLRIPAVAASAIIAALPAVAFFYFDGMNDLLDSGPRLLYLIFVFHSGCTLCWVIPFAWDLYREPQSNV